MLEELYALADELRGAGAVGLTYAHDPHDRERSERMVGAAARIIAAIEGRSAEELRGQFLDNLHHRSPLVGAEAVVVRDGRLLLIRRNDSGLWALPGGLVEVGDTVAGAALRELREETGLTGQVTRLLGIWDSRLSGSRTKAQLYHIIFEVEAGDAPPMTTPEAVEVGFFREDDLPSLSPGHQARVPMVLQLVSGALPAPYFDHPGSSLVAPTA